MRYLLVLTLIVIGIRPCVADDSAWSPWGLAGNEKKSEQESGAAKGRLCGGLEPTETCNVDMKLGQPCIGTDERNVILGGSEDDVIIGGGGDDQIMGGGGNDTICGEDGDDQLMGDDGDDNLIGGPGSNVLMGAEGADNCVEGAVVSDCEEKKSSKQAAPVKNCSDIVGKWHWFDNGTVSFASDNTVQWHEPMTGRKGHHAVWKCNVRDGSVTIPWTNGFTDTMSVISGGQALQGKNNRGMTIWAQRVPQ